MLKAWQRECNVPIGSLVIELRAVNFLRKWEHFDKGATYHHWMIRDFLAGLIKDENGTCKMAGTDEKIEYGDEWLSKAESALKRAKKACQDESEEKERSAAEEWRKVFGSQYEYLEPRKPPYPERCYPGGVRSGRLLPQDA